jgi:hypothetical protein
LTNFKEYLGTNELLSDGHDVGENHLANPLCVSVVTRTSDNRFIVEIRSKKVSSGSVGKLHVKPSGHLVSTTSSLLQKSRGVIPYPMEEAVRQESNEELALIENEISELVCTGLIISLQNRKSELTFIMRTPVSSSEIMSRPKDHGWESDTLLAMPYEPDYIKRLLVDEIQNFTPPGHAALLLAACKDFGDDWKNSLFTSLFSKKSA